MQIDEKFSSKRGRATCGTTSTTVIVYDNTLYVAHCGDSRAVLVEPDGVVGLTRDHKPADPAEAARIQVCIPELPTLSCALSSCATAACHHLGKEQHAHTLLNYCTSSCLCACTLTELVDAMPLRALACRVTFVALVHASK